MSALLEEFDITVLPGSDFYMPSTNLGVRIAAVDFDGSRALGSWLGIDNITEEYFQEFFPKIIQGGKCINEFLSSLTR